MVPGFSGPVPAILLAGKHYNDGNIIAAPAGIGGGNQFTRDRIRIVVAFHDLGDRGVLDMRYQAVAAEQQLVAAAHLERDRLGAGDPALPRPERTGDHVLMLMMTRLFGRDLSDLNQSLHQRMIFGDLAENAAFENVSAAISHPRYRTIRRNNRGAYSGGTHPARLGPLLLVLDDEAVGLFESGGQGVSDRMRFAATKPVLNIVTDGLYGNCAGGLAGLGAAHPVADDIKKVLRRLDLGVAKKLQRHDRVFVQLAHHADVAERGGADFKFAALLEQLSFQRVDIGPAIARIKLHGPQNQLFERRRDHVRRVKTDRPSLLAPGFRLQAVAREHRVEQRADGKNIGAFVDFLAAINLRRRIAVVENRIGLKLVVVGDVTEAGHLDPAVGGNRYRLRTNVIEPQPAPMNEAHRLTN